MRHLRYGLFIVALGLIGTACGGGDTATSGGESATIVNTGDTAVSDESSTQPAEQLSLNGIEIPEYFVTADSLIPELAGLPVPEGAVFAVGDAFDEAADPRQTAVQSIFLSLPVEDVAAFYLDALPAAGYEIVSGGDTDLSEIAAAQHAVIQFNDPTGLPGQVIIAPGAFAASQVNVNVFRGGVR